MDSIKNKHFCVIQFIHRPHLDIGKYVIVPDSWIKPRGNRISVSIPNFGRGQIEDFYDDDPKETYDQIIWNEYLSELKHTAESYDQALEFTTEENNKDRQNPRISVSEVGKITPLKSNQRKRSHHESTKTQECMQSKQGDLSSLEPSEVELAVKLTDILGKLLVRARKYLNTSTSTGPVITELVPLTDNASNPINAATSSNCVSTEPKETSHDTMGDEREASEGDPTQKTNKEASDSLPEEYFQDLTWTLNHPRKKPDLERLVPGFDIYVRSEKIKKIRKQSINKSELYHSLLLEVFTEQALKLCNLSKKSIAGSAKRPALHKHAILAIGVYVRKIAKKNDWIFEEDSFKTDLSKRLYNIRNMKPKSDETSFKEK